MMAGASLSTCVVTNDERFAILLALHYRRKPLAQPSLLAHEILLVTA